MNSQPPPIALQRDMLAIADLWPELDATRGAIKTNAPGRKAAPDDTEPAPLAIATQPMPISAHVADVKAEIAQWVTFLARVLMDEVTVETPVPGPVVGTWANPWHPSRTSTPALLREIAMTRVGHFTAHPDEGLRIAVADDAERLRKLAAHTARPSDRRTVRLGIPCEQYATSDLGERITCTGQYTTVLDPDAPLGDFVCTQDETHRMTPLEWQRAQRRDVSRDRDLDTLLHSGRRWSSEGAS